MLGHLEGFGFVPVAKCWLVANDCQRLAGAQLRCAHLQLHDGGIAALGHGLLLAQRHTVGKGRTVEVTVIGHVVPVVIGNIAVGLGCIQVQTVRHDHPLVAGLLAVAFHTVVVVDVSGLGGYVYVAFPDLVVGRLHGMAADVVHVSIIDDVEYQILTIDGAVLDVESNFHD